MSEVTPIARFGTGLIQTSIDRVGEGIRWTRVPGINNSAGLRPVLPELSAKIDRVGSPGLQYVAPRTSTRFEVSWDVSSATTLASVVLMDPESNLARRSVARFGAGLAAFHHDRASSWAPAESKTPAMDRFLGWIDGSPIDDARAGRAWRCHLRRVIGGEGFAVLKDCATALSAPHPSVQLHGWPTLGSVLVGEQGQVEVLVGTDLACGVPELDISTVLGELAEFGDLQNLGSANASSYDHLAHTFIEAYGTDLDVDRCNRGALMRIAIHSADFATYVGWHDELDKYAELIKKQINDLTV